jgi:chromate transport protein ChrA
VLLENRLLTGLKRSQAFRAFLKGVNAAVVASIAVAATQLARSALAPSGQLDAASVAVGVAALALLARFHTPAHWLVLGGIAAGILTTLLRQP